MEPIFKKEAYRGLVPQILVRTGGKGSQAVNLLDAGHRAADAVVRFSGLASDLKHAFLSVKNDGNAEPLAKIAPTSLVFGAWDSRETQVKLPRIVRSVIRAFEVKALHRSAQYIPPVEYVDEGLLEPADNKRQQDAMSREGLHHAPATWKHGGVQPTGEIRRDATLNLVALRSLAAASPERTLALRRYILGLSLLSLTSPQDNFLREGCQLVPNAEKTTEWNVVRYDGRRESLNLKHDDALTYARLAAAEFGVGVGREIGFDPSGAKKVLSQSKEEAKKERRAKAKSAEPEAEE
jgi:CRISPR-associated protein Csb1